MQYYYIKNNPNPIGEKHKLLEAPILTRYTDLHAKVHGYFTTYVEKFGYYYLFLVEANNRNVIYSVFKEMDYATSLFNDPYVNSNLAQVVDKVLATGKTAFVDFQIYTPSYDAPAAFLAAPVMRNYEVIGAVILQVPVDAINEIMEERTGMGETGESYLVGPDNLMRSDSFLSPQSHTVVNSFINPTKGKVNTASTKAALAGKSGNDIIIDYNGNSVLSSYGFINSLGLNWAILAEID